MDKNNLFLGGLAGTGLSAIGTATQTNDVLQTISLIITIVGAVISMILIPVLNWWAKAKKDGKITADEIKEGIEIATDGAKKVEEATKQAQDNNDKEDKE